MSFYGSLVVVCSFPLFKGDSTRRACRKAVSKTVAVIITQQFGFAVYHADGTFVAGFGAQTAAIAFFFIYGNNFSDHIRVLLAFLSEF